jgi:limonene-1,2-epoxide hydrolase
MSEFSPQEVRATVDAYVALRERIEAGDATWTDLATMFTDDAVYIDPAWGRIQGIDELREFFDESMRGLEDWDFPIEFTAIDGDTVVIKWTQQLPGARARRQPLRAVRCLDVGLRRRRKVLLRGGPAQHDPRARGPQARAAGRPGEGFMMPPAQPDRNFARP